MAERPKLPPLKDRVDAWLRESGLTRREMPGEEIVSKDQYKMYLHDIDGQRTPAGDMSRQFEPTRGVRALTDNSEAPKYQYPANEPPHIYYPPLVKGKKFDWRAWARDALRVKLATEGWKKAAAASKLGFPTIGLNGCWGFSGKKWGYLYLPEFNDWQLDGAEIYWIPDRDRKPESVADVARANAAFGHLMTEAGASFHVVQLPLRGEGKTGLDDYLRACSNGDFPHLIQETGVWEDWPVSDPGNADRWAATHGARFRHLGRRGWYVYGRERWRPDDLSEHQASAQAMFKGMIEDAVAAGNTERAAMLAKHATAQRIKSVCELAKADPTVAARPEEFDRRPLLLNCKNGTLDLETMTLRAHDPSDRITRMCAASWDPMAPCPNFLGALNWWTNGDIDLQRTVQQLAGLSLTGITREQVFVVLHGPPATGKSRFIEIFRHVLADYARALPSDLLLQRQNGPDEERKMAKLLGVRFAAASETEAGGVLDENLVKQLTGEDGVSGRFLYGESFDFMPEAKVWLRTNNPPHVRGADGAVWRRLVSVPFGHEVPPGKIDRDLPEKLKAEADGVLAWAVEGYRDYAEGGLYRARAVEESAAEYRRDESAVERFLESKCILEPTARCGRDELFRAFEAWLRERKWRAWRAGDFKRALLATGKAREVQVRIEGSLQRVWAGLRLRTMEDVKASIVSGVRNV